jgi:hypothetical protein
MARAVRTTLLDQAFDSMQGLQPGDAARALVTRYVGG